MNPAPVAELNDRARDIFRVVVESYLNTGAPIGSRAIAHLSGLNLSPASIRNVMQDLEELGLLAAPHTSAGRMPTEIGLRLFVDGMMQALEPSAEEQAAIAARLTQTGPVEEAIAATTAAGSGLDTLLEDEDDVVEAEALLPESELQAAMPNAADRAIAATMVRLAAVFLMFTVTP